MGIGKRRLGTWRGMIYDECRTFYLRIFGVWYFLDVAILFRKVDPNDKEFPQQ